MKRLLSATTIALVMSLSVQSAGAVVKSDQDLGFARTKSGLLMSAGVIELIQAEGDISLEDERITCHRVRKTGSHLKETFCMTQREAEIARTRNQRTMWRFLNGVAR